MEIWPNFFIVGAGKAGTTSLYEYLNNTPGVYMSLVKEPHYFHNHEKYLGARGIRIREKSKYLKLFKGVKDEKVIGEASPAYLRDPDSAELIHKQIPNARIIILLRDPIERAFSNYLMRRGNGQEKRKFHEVISSRLNKKQNPPYDLSIDPGLYANQVQRYLDVFGSKQVRILIFEEFINDPIRTTKVVLDFLGVNAEPPQTIGKTFNPYGVPRGKLGSYVLSNKTIWELSLKFPQSIRWKTRKLLLKKEKKPKISSEDRYALENFYRDDVKRLEKILKCKMPWNWV